MKLDRKCKQARFLIFPLLMAPVMLAQTPPPRALTAPPVVPDNLKVPTGQVVQLEAQARGVQLYECKAVVARPSQFEWIFKAPQAILFDNKGNKIGQHFAGPTWEANDGSLVVGLVKASAKPNPSAIPWLLLQAKSHKSNGTFSAVTYIQRVDTVAGVAPAQKCDHAHVGTEVRVNYRANYFFYSLSN